MVTSQSGRWMRAVAMGAVLLSLLAPWYPFWDGGGAPGWLALAAAFVFTNSKLWLLYRLAFMLLAAVLALATLIAFDVASLGRRAGRWQPLLLVAALAVVVGVAPATAAASLGTLWGLWLTASCVAAALLVEVAMLLGPRLRRAR